jgi:hypothetical protein
MKTAAKAAWKGVDAETLEAGDWKDLLEDRAAYLRISGFLDADWCAELVRRFVKTEPPVYEIRGSCHNRMELGSSVRSVLNRAREQILLRSDELNRKLKDFYAGGVDPADKLRQALEPLGWSAADAVKPGAPYLPQYVWGFPPGSFLELHRDNVQEPPEVFARTFPLHLSWNVFLGVSEEGGKFCVYDRRVRAGDEAFEEGQYCYKPELVKGLRPAGCFPKAGDLILFNSENYHKVTLTGGRSFRIAAHSFAALDPKRRDFAFWV